MTRSWLDGAVAEPGALAIPGRPSASAASVKLTEEFVILVKDGTTANLPWGEYLAAGQDSWNVSSWIEGRGGPIGVALTVRGASRDATERVRVRTRTIWNRLNALLNDQIRVPLCARGRISRTSDRERCTFAALTTVLSRRPDLRSRLNDSTRVQRLAAELGPGALGRPVLHTGVRGATIEVLTAMRSAGYQYPFDRPLPGDPLPGVDEAVAEVTRRIRTNPYAAGIEVDEDHVRSVLDENYFGIKPWPFEALTDP